jgi:hypothetical protein
VSLDGGATCHVDLTELEKDYKEDECHVSSGTSATYHTMWPLCIMPRVDRGFVEVSCVGLTKGKYPWDSALSPWSLDLRVDGSPPSIWVKGSQSTPK